MRKGQRLVEDVAAYSIRVGGDAVDLVFQSRVSPPARTAHIHNNVIRCFGASKGAGTVVDVSLIDGSEVRRQTDLPAFGQLTFASSGFGLGTIQTGRVGAAETTLTFLTPEATVIGTASVPDAVSEVADAGGVWYVGCRDGYLYAYLETGDLLWRWETPGARNHAGDSYFRPCPYYVTSDGERAVVSSMGDIYCISPAGASIWHFTLPSDEALADKELSGFRLDDFDDEDGLAFEFAIVGMATIVSRIIASSDAILIGASDGRFFDLSPTGELREAHTLGESSVGPVVDADGALAAVAAGETIFRWEEGRFHRAAELAETPERVGVWRNGLWVQNRKQLDILDWTGKLIWSVEF